MKERLAQKWFISEHRVLAWKYGHSILFNRLTINKVEPIVEKFEILF